MKISKVCLTCKHEHQINPQQATAEVTDLPYLEFNCQLGIITAIAVSTRVNNEKAILAQGSD